MVLLHLFEESQTRLADFGYIPECKSKNPRGLNERSLPVARMDSILLYWNVNYITFQWFTIGLFSKYTKNVNIGI